MNITAAELEATFCFGEICETNGDVELKTWLDGTSISMGCTGLGRDGLIACADVFVGVLRATTVNFLVGLGPLNCNLLVIHEHLDRVSFFTQSLTLFYWDSYEVGPTFDTGCVCMPIAALHIVSVSICVPPRGRAGMVAEVIERSAASFNSPRLSGWQCRSNSKDEGSRRNESVTHFE